MFTLKPIVSVIMSAYNAEKFIANSIESILNQTLQEFELIIIDDASTDSTLKIIESYTDSRIIVLKNDFNKGQSTNLNKAIDMTRGKYVAKADADDICMPNRLEVQVKYLEEHPDISLISSYMNSFGDEIVQFRPLLHDDDIRIRLLFKSVLPHPGFMMRLSDINKANIRYNNQFKYAQDYDFQARASDQLKLAVIPRVLIKYRIHGEQISVAKQDEQKYYANQVRVYQLKRLGIHLKEQYISKYEIILYKKNALSIKEWNLILFVFDQILKRNSLIKMYNEKRLKNEIKNFLTNYIENESNILKKKFYFPKIDILLNKYQ